MLRRLLEASTGPGAQQPVSQLPGASAGPALLTSPVGAPANLTATPTASSPSAAAVATAAAAVDAALATTTTTTTVAATGHLSPGHVYNSTVSHSENDELEYSILAAFSDMETVLLACISTLLPLIVALAIAFGIRHVWRKYRARRSSTASGLPWYRGVCSRDDTAESLRHRPHSVSGSQTIQPPNQILSAQDLVNGMDGGRYICETDCVMEEAALAAEASYASPESHSTSKAANGNIITLTLRNNHLIVETEERAVTVENPRNRKFQDNDCSVIVEVPPGYQSDETDANRGSADDISGRITDQQVLVHREERPEDRSSGFDNAKLFGSTNTGLSQSDLSICSQGSVNPSYRYGNQLEYEAGHFGYPMYGAGGGEPPPRTDGRKLDASSKWVEFDKSPDTEKTLLEGSNLEKDGSESVSSPRLKQDSSQDSTEPSSEAATVRSNPRVNGAATLVDIDLKSSTKPVITGALLKDEASLQEDTFQEQQRKLGNGTLTPEHRRLEESTDLNSRPEANNKEQQQQQQQQNKALSPRPEGFIPTHKRTGSIPPRLIEESLELERKKTLDIYSQIKSSTKSLLPGLSPKFELLQNEVSPVDEKES